MQPHNEYRLRLQSEAAKNLLASLRETYGDEAIDNDAELRVDAIEGETNLTEAIAAAFAAREEALMQIAGIKDREEKLDLRKKRLTGRADRLKAMIEQAMVAAELPSLPLAEATLTIGKRARQIIITEEADIPVKYWVEQPRPAPKPDKKALLADARERDTHLQAALFKCEAIEDEIERKAAIAAAHVLYPAIPGVDLDNGGVQLSIRKA